MKIKRKNIFLLIIVGVLLSALLLALSAYKSFRWQKAAEAAGGLPYQIGLTNVIIIPCFPIPKPPMCVGGTLCFTLDVDRCSNYSDVSGKSAGGMGPNALFSNEAIMAVGLTTGGQLIAAGMAPVAMDNGVLASAGGCFGCGVAKADWTDKFFNWLDKYIIAGIKGN